jgi:dTDP-glucose pyrophosphorylase
MKKIKELLIRPETRIIDALQQMDGIGRKLLIVAENGRFIGLLSIGDIQRAILEKIDLKTAIRDILRHEIKIGSSGQNIEVLKREMLHKRMEYMPILDENDQIEDVLFWEELFPKEASYANRIEIPVMIMAGGKGTRMKPFTNVLPKAMIPVHEHTVIEEIMDKFQDQGAGQIYISVNHQANLIENYLSDKKYVIEYVREDKPLGTAGALQFVKNKIKSSFFVINCDTLINEDYTKIIDYHKKNKNKITIISAIKTIRINFGVIETDPGGIFKKIEEKPDYNFQINSGFYLLEPEVLSYIPENQKFNMPDLILAAQEAGEKIGVFPVSEKSWQDLGQWEFYQRFLKTL